MNDKLRAQLPEGEDRVLSVRNLSGGTTDLEVTVLAVGADAVWVGQHPRLFGIRPQDIVAVAR